MLSRSTKSKVKSKRSNNLLIARILPFYFLLFTLCLNLSCGSKPTDLRSLAPADSLIYLETNDLGAAIQPIIDSKAFGDAAMAKPDLSTIKDVQVAIAVTGFETSEQQINEENAILNFRPHFVAIADTHAWSWQARSFAENQLGEFVNKLYGGGVQLDTAPKDGGTKYVWTAEDGRKAFGYVTGSLIFFGNDESSIDKVQAVRRGESDPIAKTGKLPDYGGYIAIGYVSADGIAQIANIIGAQKAKESGEESEVQSFVARIVPQLLRGAIKEATWTARTTESGYEDKLNLTLDPAVANVLNETMAPADTADSSLLDFAPPDAASITQYNLKDPQIAWRSILLLTQKLTDPSTGKLIVGFSNSFFEPYGIKDGEMFLGAVSPNIVTVKFDEDDDVAVIGKTKDDKSRKLSLDAESMKSDSADSEITDPGFEGISVTGESGTVQKCVQAHQNAQNLRSDPISQASGTNIAAARTIGIDRDSAALLASVLNQRKGDDVAPASRFTVETRFNKTGMERKLDSEFGLIGSLITMLASGE
jgi:hypothetical protein